MIEYSIPVNEKERLENLKSFSILDSLPEKEYDEITQLASQICGTPVSLISLIDENRQWFKSTHGISISETPRNLAFCNHTICQKQDVLIVPDSRMDDRFSNNPFVTDIPNIVFYAGVKLVSAQGFSLGTLCVIDQKPRKLTEGQINGLRLLANQVIKLFELRQSLKKIKKSEKKLQDLNTTKDRLFSIISHDLRGPIGGLKNFVQMLISSKDYTNKEEMTRNLSAIQENAASTYDLLENLLDWSISEQNQITYAPETLTLHEMVQCTKRVLTGLSHAKNIFIDNQIEENLKVYADKNMLMTILRNLISNALKFTPDGKQVSIYAKVFDKHTKIYVCDEGQGMEITHQARLFKKADYFSSYGTNGEKGSGLGLLLCKDFVEKHNGSIGVISEPNKGSTFYFTLPNP